MIPLIIITLPFISSLTSVLQYSMKKIFLLLLFAYGLLFANDLSSETYPKIYAQLGTPLFKQAQSFTALSRLKPFSAQEKIIHDYWKKAEAVLKQGKEAERESPLNEKAVKAYLKELRKLQTLHDSIIKNYKRQLYKSIRDNDPDLFYALTSVTFSFLSTDARLKKEVVSYYKKSKHTDIAYLEKLSKDLSLDESSYAYINTMFKTSRQDLQVEQRTALNEFVPDSDSKNPIKVLSIKTKNGFDIYLENHTYYDVSIQLKAVKLVNMSSSEPLPYLGSFPAQSRTKILKFTIQDPHQASQFQTLYSTTMGRVNPDYDKNYLYALPYERGKSHQLTQGFNGEQTHKGQSAYALDFKMDEGTKIHAMREGVVVALEEKQTEHGFSPEFANKANFIVIQHDDGTMAMYGHLQPNGVKVRLGQKVYKHALIGLSGNTGYSSGPHLHVHITAIKDLSSGSTSVPFVFLTQDGRIETPQTHAFYTAK